MTRTHAELGDAEQLRRAVVRVHFLVHVAALIGPGACAVADAEIGSPHEAQRDGLQAHFEARKGCIVPGHRRRASKIARR
jgi:hypothetical protein